VREAQHPPSGTVAPRFLGSRKHLCAMLRRSQRASQWECILKTEDYRQIANATSRTRWQTGSETTGFSSAKKGSILRLIPSRGDTLPQCKLLFQQDLPRQRNPFCSVFKSDDVWRDAVPPGTLLCWRRPSGRPPDSGSPSPGSEQVQPETAAASADRRRPVHRCVACQPFPTPTHAKAGLRANGRAAPSGDWDRWR
jgi:hypothetical protein